MLEIVGPPSDNPRMRRAWLPAVAILAALSGAAPQDKDPLKLYQAKLKRVWTDLADKHNANASFCESKKQNGWANAELERALGFDPDHQIVRRKLGYKKVNGQWVRDPDAKVKTTNDLKDEEQAAEVGRRYSKMLDEMGKSVALKYVDAAQFAERNQLAEQAAESWRLALAYDPNNKDARKKLGYTLEKGSSQWLTPATAELLKLMKSAAGAAPKGEASTEATEVQQRTGLGGQIRRSPHFVLESTTYDQNRLGALAQLAEGAVTLYQKLMELSGDEPLGSVKPNLVYYKIKPEHERLVEAYLDNPRMREDFKKGGGVHLGDVHEVWVLPRGERNINDWTVHAAVHSLVAAHAGGRRPWLQEGLCYVFTFMMLGTADNHCTSLQDTSVKGRQKDFKEGSKWRGMLKDMVVEMNDPEIQAVLKADIADLDGPKTLKAWSLVDYLIHDHMERFAQIVKKLRDEEKDGGPEKIFEQVLGWNAAELNERWRQYVRATY
jgi:hypothetical protein